MLEPSIRWQRRKDARPAEIIDAAISVFTEKGYAATKLDEVAKRAGIAKGTLYLYFDTKEDIFRAAACHAFESNLNAIGAADSAPSTSLRERLPELLLRLIDVANENRFPTIFRMVISESHLFPDLARIWHDDVASRILDLIAALVVQAQMRGEVRDGDPRLFAFSITGPLLAGMLFRETYGAFSSHTPELKALAVQHAATVLDGLLLPAQAQVNSSTVTSQ
jgi:AcrR family transcriptional regulator